MKTLTLFLALTATALARPDAVWTEDTTSGFDVTITGEPVAFDLFYSPLNDWIIAYAPGDITIQNTFSFLTIDQVGDSLETFGADGWTASMTDGSTAGCLDLSLSAGGPDLHEAVGVPDDLNCLWSILLGVIASVMLYSWTTGKIIPRWFLLTGCIILSGSIAQLILSDIPQVDKHGAFVVNDSGNAATSTARGVGMESKPTIINTPSVGTGKWDCHNNHWVEATIVHPKRIHITEPGANDTWHVLLKDANGQWTRMPGDFPTRAAAEEAIP